MGQDKIICMAPYRPKTTKADIKSWNPGVTPLYKPYSYMPPYRVGFLRRFGLKTGIHFAHFVWNRVWFLRELRECMNVFIISIPNE